MKRVGNVFTDLVHRLSGAEGRTAGEAGEVFRRFREGVERRVRPSGDARFRLPAGRRTAGIRP